MVSHISAYLMRKGTDYLLLQEDLIEDVCRENAQKDRGAPPHPNAHILSKRSQFALQYNKEKFCLRSKNWAGLLPLVKDWIP